MKVTFAMAPGDALRFAGYLDNLRTDDIYTEKIGLPDGTDLNMDRCFAYPFSEYGDVKEACLAVEDNDLSLMLIYQNYRVEYALSAQKQWSNVAVSAYSGTSLKYSYDFFNRLSTEHVMKLETFFKGKLIAGQDNLYSMLGSDSSNPNFLREYIYKITLNKI
ncbi:MAG: hypothetical protein K6G24_14260 [Lachnospiraceae bacterium]|nr:hypothetical protein [Lachnospiraceae bacterium]